MACDVSPVAMFNMFPVFVMYSGALRMGGLSEKGETDRVYVIPELVRLAS